MHVLFFYILHSAKYFKFCVYFTYHFFPTYGLVVFHCMDIL